MILISCDEDGDVRIRKIPKDEFLEKFNVGAWGNNVTMVSPDEPNLREGHSIDPNEFRVFTLILIDGDVVRPFAKEKIVEWGLP